MHDRFDRLAKQEGMARGRPAGQKRRGAEREIERLSWLDWPLVHWGGDSSVSLEPSPSVRHFRSVASLVAEEMVGRPASLLAVRCAFIAEKAPDRALHRERLRNPTVEICPVTTTLLEDTARSLTRLRRYPVELPKLEDDPAGYLEARKARLRLVSAVHRAFEGQADDPLETLALEERAVWLGDPKARPSGSIARDSVRAALADADGFEPGARLAAVLAGRWGPPGPNLPGTLSPWVRLGSTLNRWPVDLVAKLPEDDVPRLLAWLRTPEIRDALSAPGPAEAFREICLLDRASSVSLSDFLRGSVLMQDAVERILEEPARRRWGFLEEISYAVGRRTHRANEWKDRDRLLVRTGLAGSLSIEDERLPAFDLWSFDLPELWREWLGSPIDPDLDEASHMDKRRLVYEHVAPLDLTVRGGAWTRDSWALAGRIAARSGTSCIPQLENLWRWLEECRRTLRPGVDGTEAIGLALIVLDRGFPYTLWDPDHGEAFLEALGGTRFSESLLSHLREAQATRREEAGSSEFDRESWEALWNGLPWGWTRVWSLTARLGRLGPEARSVLLRFERPDDYPTLLFDARDILEERPEALEPYLLRVGETAETEILSDLSDLYRAFELETVEEILDWDELWSISNPDADHVRGLRKLLVGLAYNALDSRGHGSAEFLRSHSWSLGLVRGCLPDFADPEFDQYGSAAIVDAIITARIWSERGHAGVRSLFETLLGAIVPEGTGSSLLGSARLGLLVDISGGNIERMRVLFEHRSSLRSLREPEIARLSRLLKENPTTLGLLREMASRSRHAPSVIRALLRLSIVARLPTDPLDDALSPAAEPDLSSVSSEVRKAADEDLLERLGVLSALRRESGHDPDFPGSIRKILSRRETLTREKAVLESKEEAGEASEPMRIRLRRIEGWLEDPDHVTDWILEDLERVVDDSLSTARNERLEAAIDEAFRSHLRSITGADRPDFESDRWANALSLHLQLNQLGKNRRLLTRLLASACREEDDWPRSHPGNVRFLERMAERGLDVEAWTAERREAFHRGEEPLTVHVERDALRILEMGNLFDTCLSVGKFNAFTSVAAAVEVDKAVLYVLDSENNAVGRKLVVLSPEGELVGFRSYGARRSPWIKIALDLFCRRWALDLGAELAMEPERRPVLGLFADSQFDAYTEPFDWWILHLESEEAPLSVAEELVSRLGTDGAGGFDPADHRALLWLGDRAAELIRSPLRSSAPEGEDHSESIEAFLLKHADSEALREAVREAKEAQSG